MKKCIIFIFICFFIFSLASCSNNNTNTQTQISEKPITISYITKTDVIDYINCKNGKEIRYSSKVPKFNNINSKTDAMIQKFINSNDTEQLKNITKEHKQMCKEKKTVVSGYFTVDTMLANVYSNKYLTFTLKQTQDVGTGAGACHDNFTSLTIDKDTNQIMKLSNFASNKNNVLKYQLSYLLHKKNKNKFDNYNNSIINNVVPLAFNPTNEGLKLYYPSGILFACIYGSVEYLLKWDKVLSPNNKDNNKWTYYYSNDKVVDPMAIGIQEAGGGLDEFRIRQMINLKNGILKYTKCSAWFMSMQLYKDKQIQHKKFPDLPKPDSTVLYSKQNMNNECKNNLNITVFYRIRGNSKIAYVYNDSNDSLTVVKITFKSKTSNKITNIKQVLEL